MNAPFLDPDDLFDAERRVQGELPPVSPFSLHGSLAPPEALPFQAPLAPEARPGLVTRLMRTPSSSAATPFENQVTEALAWLVDHCDAFARALAEALVGDDEEARAMVARSTSFGAHTQVRMPPLPWAERQVADLSIVDAGRHVQIIVEVKVGAPFSESFTPDGARLDQPESYLAAWNQGALAGQARARRLATISIGGPPTPPPPDAMRARDLTWSRDLVPLLAAFSDEPRIGAVASELAKILGERLAPPLAAGTDPDLGALRAWADVAILDAVRRLMRDGLEPTIRLCAEDGTLREPARSRTNVGRTWTGCYLSVEKADGRVVFWFYLCTAGAPDNLPTADRPVAALALWSPRSVDAAFAVLGPTMALFSTSPDRGGRRWPRRWSDAEEHRNAASPATSLAIWLAEVLGAGRPGL